MEWLFTYLKTHNLTLSSCESFTAGLFAHSFCQIPGASAIYVGGYVSYTDRFKAKIVNISNKIIKKYSIVSKEVSQLMARKTAKLTNTDVSFSFTGWAPPSVNNDLGHAFCSFYYKGKIKTIEINNATISDRTDFQKLAISKVLQSFQKYVITKEG